MDARKNMLFCPVTMACKMLQPRWTIQILAEMWWGSTHFNEIRRGVPGISPTLLSKRLRELEANGLVERVEDPSSGHVEYLRTQAAVDLEPIIEALGRWAYQHCNTQSKLDEADAKVFVWNLRRSIDTSALPARRVVIKLHFPDQPADLASYWIVSKPGAPVDVCYLDPGYEVDLYLTCDLHCLVSVYFGHTRLSDEIECTHIQLIGQAAVARTIDRWLQLSSYADPSAEDPLKRV